MKRQLSTTFDARQYMQSGDLEIFYYHDVNLNHISFHQHEYYEIYFFLEGDVDYQIGDSRFKIQYGDYLLIPPHVPHCPAFSSKNVPYRRFVLWLSSSFYNSLLDTSSDFSYGFHYAAERQQYRFSTDTVTAQHLTGLLMELLEEKNGGRVFQQQRCRTMASAFLLELNRMIYEARHNMTAAYENTLYLNVCDYINNHLEEDLSLNMLAAFFFVSKYHICHIFKENMGISPHQYIVKKRLQASKHGILSGTPFQQLIYQYGFHDYSSFYRAFKKEFGLSPSEFRSQHQLPVKETPADYV